MHFDPDHYSKYALRRFAILVDVICLVVIGTVAYGIYVLIEWVAA